MTLPLGHCGNFQGPGSARLQGPALSPLGLQSPRCTEVFEPLPTSAWKPGPLLGCRRAGRKTPIDWGLPRVLPFFPAFLCGQETFWQGRRDVKVTQAASGRARRNKSPSNKQEGQQGIQSMLQSEVTKMRFGSQQLWGASTSGRGRLCSPLLCRPWQVTDGAVLPLARRIVRHAALARETCSWVLWAQTSLSDWARLCPSFKRRGG